MTAGGRVRVGVLDHTATMSGAEVALLRFLPELDAARLKPVVVLFAAGPLEEHLRSAGIEVHVVQLDKAIAATDRSDVGRLSWRSARDGTRTAAYTLRLARRLRQLKLDLVLTNSLKADLIGGLAARLTGTPVVWYMHDRISADYLPARVARLLRLLARRIPRHVIANSQATLDTLLPLRDGTWTVAYPGLPNSAFSAGRRSALSKHPVVGMVGRISPTKGQDVFLRAAARIHAANPQVRFVIVGSALFNEHDFERDVRRLCGELGLRDRVEFTGQVGDVHARMRDFSVLVHASPVPEPFGQVVVEAMAAGVPIVATRAGGVVEILGTQSGEYGLLVDPGDDHQLAGAVSSLLDDPKWATEMALRARERARTTFTSTATAECVSRALDRALTR